MKKDEYFSEEIANAIDLMYDNVYENGKILKLSELKKDNTALIIIDMVNGFVKEGSLSSKRVLDINNSVAELSECFETMGIKRIAFADSHNKESVEFENYPEHCIKGTSEEKLTSEIEKTNIEKIIKKGSTNGFIEKEFLNWLKENKEVDCFVVTGCCTDICVLQFCLNLKTYFNRANRKCRVIVPSRLVETYDAPGHDGDLSNLWALNNLFLNGIEVVEDYE